jgi:hypothetical protein
MSDCLVIYIYIYIVKHNGEAISTGHTQVLFQKLIKNIYAPHKNDVFFNPCAKITLHCNHRSGHLKTEHTESLLLLRRHLDYCSRRPAVSMRNELLVAPERLGVSAADSVCLPV